MGGSLDAAESSLARYEAKLAARRLSIRNLNSASAYQQGYLRCARELRETGPWLPMATAPRDGTEILIEVEYRAGIPGKLLVGHYQPGGYCIEDHPPIDEGWYFWTGRIFDIASRPLRWMPLPP